MQDTTVLSGVVNDCVTRTVLGLACPGRRVCPHPVNGGHPVSRPIQNTPDGAGFRDGLVVMLTPSTGALDAVTFLCLGKVFSSVITGNLALLGVAAAQHDATLALNGGLALAGYAAGVLLGSVFVGTRNAASRSGPLGSPSPWPLNWPSSSRSLPSGWPRESIAVPRGAWRCSCSRPP